MRGRGSGSLLSFPHHMACSFDASSEASTKVEVPTGLGSMVARDSKQTLGHQTEVDLINAQGKDAGCLSRATGRQAIRVW